MPRVTNIGSLLRFGKTSLKIGLQRGLSARRGAGLAVGANTMPFTYTLVVNSSHSLERTLSRAGLSPKRQKGLIAFFNEELHLGVLKHFEAICLSFVGEPIEIKSWSHYFTFGGARAFVRHGVLAEDEWDVVADKMLAFILRIPNNAPVVFAELIESLAPDANSKDVATVEDIIQFLVKKSRAVGFHEDVVATLWQKTAFHDTKGITRFGKHVLALPAAEQLSHAELGGRLNALRSLYLHCDKHAYEENLAYFVSHAQQGSEHRRASFAHELCMLESMVYREHIDVLVESVQTEPLPRFIVAHALHSAYEDKRDVAFKIAEEVAFEVLPEAPIRMSRRAPWAGDANELQLRLVEWLAKHFGKRAKRALKKYRNKNYVIMVKSYYPLIAEHLGQDGADILYSGFSKSAVSGGIFGFMEHATYYQRLLQLTSKLDMSKYSPRIETTLKTHKSKGVEALASMYFAPDPGEKRVQKPNVEFCLSLKSATRQVLDALIPALVEKLIIGPISALEINIDWEDEASIVKVSARDGESTVEVHTKIALWTSHPSLDAFALRHQIPPEHFSWSDTEKLPASIYLSELGKALSRLPAELSERGISTTERVELQLDLRPVDEFVATYEWSAKRQVGYQFVTNLAAREFALLCYEDEEDQRVVESWASPLVVYRLKEDDPH